MNTLEATATNRESERSHDLLEYIRCMRVKMGDELTDEEFTRLLIQLKPPGEACFTFLSYQNRFVMFGVPKQECANWYPEKGWIRPEKEKIVKGIAEKYGFTFCEPPDVKDPCADVPNPHHHLQLSNRTETVVIIHPQFLKVRLFGLASYGKNAQKPLHMKCELLKDLSGLYQCKDDQKSFG